MHGNEQTHVELSHPDVILHVYSYIIITNYHVYQERMLQETPLVPWAVIYIYTLLAPRKFPTFTGKC